MGEYVCQHPRSVSPALLAKKQVKNLNLKILYYNCQGLASEERLYKLEKSLDKIKWDIIGLSEVKRKGTNLVRRNNGSYFFYHGSTAGYRGVGFYINKRLVNRVVEIKGVTERIAVLKLKLNDTTKIAVIQVYSPTNVATNEENKEFINLTEKVANEEKEYGIIRC